MPIDRHFPDQLGAIVEVVDPSGIEFRSGHQNLARLPVLGQQCQSSGSGELLRLPEVAGLGHRDRLPRLSQPIGLSPDPGLES